MILSGRARVAGVMGWPVGHSWSPRIHGYWLRRYHIDGAYVPLPVQPESLAAALAALPKLGFRGVSVTIPHKEAAMACMAEVSEAARAIGAVNTVVVQEDGALRGTNTDASGFLEAVRSAVPHWCPSAGPALVLGAGGAARAVVSALGHAGVPLVRVANRSPGRAERLAADIGGRIEPVAWDDRAAAAADTTLLVNATSLGMAGQPPLDMPLGGLPTSSVVVDIVYQPLQTPLLAAAAARGNITVDGLGMLLHQARPAFAAWFGVDPEVTAELRAFVLQDTEH